MLQIMLVDDEAIIRLGLSKNIAWESHGFRISALAEDGEQALACMEKDTPDIVITDIRMPFIDGLELAAHIRDRFPQVKVIMLTGYEDFSYAQRAIQLQTHDYILKPVNYELLLETVKKASAEILRNRKLALTISESTPLLRRQFFQQLLANRYNRSQIEAKLELLNLTLPEECYSVLIIKIDEFENEFRLKKIMEKELFKFCVMNIAEETAGEHSIIFDDGGDQIVLIIEHSGSGNEADHIAEDIRTNVKKYLLNTVSIGIGNTQFNCEHVYRSYQEALATLKFRHIYGTDTVLSFASTGAPADGRSMMSDVQEQKLAFFVRSRDEAEVMNFMERMENEFVNNKITDLPYIRMMAMQILFRIYVELEEQYLLVEMTAKSEYLKLFNSIEGLQTVKEIFDELRQAISGLIEAVRAEKTGSQALLVHKAAELIEQHFSEEDLNLQYVAKQLHINPVYLSTIFKRVKGINFSTFVQEFRMKQAMRLFTNSNLLTYEVAEKVGYSNPNYFSASFKKFTGSSPSEFKGK
jgi:two-component system response regulator YesN